MSRLKSDQSIYQISLANFFIYNTQYGQKEGRVRIINIYMLNALTLLRSNHKLKII